MGVLERLFDAALVTVTAFVAVSFLLAFLNRPEHLKRLGRRRPLTLDDLVGSGKAA